MTMVSASSSAFTATVASDFNSAGQLKDQRCYKIIDGVVCVLVGSGYSHKKLRITFRFMPLDKLNESHKKYSIYEYVHCPIKLDRLPKHEKFRESLLTEDELKFHIV